MTSLYGHSAGSNMYLTYQCIQNCMLYYIYQLMSPLCYSVFAMLDCFTLISALQNLLNDDIHIQLSILIFSMDFASRFHLQLHHIVTLLQMKCQYLSKALFHFSDSVRQSGLLTQKSMLKCCSVCGRIKVNDTWVTTNLSPQCVGCHLVCGSKPCKLLCDEKLIRYIK